MDGLHLMRSAPDKPKLGPCELHVLAVLREIVAISEAESPGSIGDVGDVGGYRDGQGQSEPRGNFVSPEEGRMILLGYV